MEDGWGKAGTVLVCLVIVSAMALFGFFAWKGEQNFKKDCVAVSGRWSYDTDSDLECYVNDKEIAEYGESSPK